MIWRDWRAGELTLLFLALALAVAAQTSVAFLADRLRLGLERDARQMIAADMVVRADHPVEAEFAARARALRLATANTVIFPSMVSGSGTRAPARLAAVKAVSPGYPLRGALRIAFAPGGPDRPALGIPAPGTVWVDATLLEALKVDVGSQIKLGTRHFKIAAVIARELDRGFSFVNFSPRVMLRADELPSTGLIGYGSRVTYRLLVAGANPQVKAFATWARQRAGNGRLRGVALESLQDGQPQMRETLDRASHCLSLVALLTALLAAVAIAMSAQRFMRRHLDGCAVMRCLDASQATLRTLFVLEFIGVGLLGALVGVLVGFVGHALLLSWLGNLISVALPWPSAWPMAEGIVSGLVLLLGFALPPLLPLARVAPVRVLRREWGEAARATWAAYVLGVLLFGAMLIVAAGELKLGGIVAGGFGLGLVLFGALARLALALGARVSRRGSSGGRPGWRYALAGLERRGGASALQITALGLGLMCLLLLGLTRHDLVAGWRAATPPDAPNHFLIDIQPDQVAAVSAYLARRGLPPDRVALAPMIRGRLMAVNGEPVNPTAYPDPQARRLVEREFNLSYTAALPSDNQIVAERWFGAQAWPQISLERGLAKRLGINLGDRLSFTVGGQRIEAPVTSVRGLDWGSLRINFIAQLQRVLTQVIGAVQFLFFFTLAAGVLVLYAALAGTRDELYPRNRAVAGVGRVASIDM